MSFEREARTVDYTSKKGLVHEEFVPPNDSAEWLRSLIDNRSVAGASEDFWNRVELFEKRKDAQLAKDVIIALPLELTSEQNIALVREFVEQYVTARGMVGDWVYHDAPGNPHVHLMTSIRPITEDGFGSKNIPKFGPDGKLMRDNHGKIAYAHWAWGLEEFNSFRDGWFSCQNRHLALAGLDICIDGRSFEKQGIPLVPTIHLGVGTKAIERRSKANNQIISLERLQWQEAICAEDARRIQRRPEIVLDLVSREKSVFDERDVAKVLSRYFDDPALFHQLLVRTLQSPKALRLEQEQIDPVTGERTPCKYTTRELIRLESEMMRRVAWLATRSTHVVQDTTLKATLARHCWLSQEQKAAFDHVVGAKGIGVVIGRAGAGKTTMMKAAREAWEAAGLRVVGGALAGKAAEGLEKDAGVPSRTLSSWELRWDKGVDGIDKRTVFVLDEAGMVSSRQMAALLATVARHNAKIVLVGDPDQLQPIEAGAAFRAIAHRIGYAELETVHRQREQWMRDASLDLARGNLEEAVSAYRAHGKIIGTDLKSEAIATLIADWAKDFDPTKTTLMLAHLRRDVRTLNEMARAKLIDQGIIAEGSMFRTENGIRRFATGDQIVFLKNDALLGVKNGMLGKVIEAAPSRLIAEVGRGRNRRQFTIEERTYNSVAHGYATTIHKSQGMTVDRVKVLGSLSLDRHLTYVAMTRHREDLLFYFGKQSMEKAGGLIKVLSRRNAKEITLDYASATHYRQALYFAEARGLHLVNVARTIARDHLEWTVRQKERFAILAQRLVAIGMKLTDSIRATVSLPQDTTTWSAMVSGIATFENSTEQAVGAKLESDSALKAAWEEVSMRFHLVYAQPETAFKAVNADKMLENETYAKSTLVQISSHPELYGALKGKTGWFASRADAQDRNRAEDNIRALGSSLGSYLRLLAEARKHYHREEIMDRQKASISIPTLSATALTKLELIRDAIDRNDRSSALRLAIADDAIKAELAGFTNAISMRFGERSMLSLDAKDTNGKTFQSITAGMTSRQKAEVRSAWSIMRTAQQLAAYQRSEDAMKKAEALRQTLGKGISIC